MSDINQRLSSLHEARDAFFKALKVHENSIYKIGYEDGYGAGWEAALNKLAEIKPEVNFSTQGPTDLSHLLHSQSDEVPTHDTLLTIIKQHPGLRREEIIDTAAKHLPNLNERTVRTALQRMKNAGDLHATDGKWYIAEKPKKSGRSSGGSGSAEETAGGGTDSKDAG